VEDGGSLAGTPVSSRNAISRRRGVLYAETSTPDLDCSLLATSGLSLRHRYHAGMRREGSAYFQRKGLAAF